MSEPGCPKGETGKVGYYNRSGELIFLLTTKNNNNDWFFLYEVTTDGALKKLGKAKTPPELENRYKVVEKMFA